MENHLKTKNVPKLMNSDGDSHGHGEPQRPLATGDSGALSPEDSAMYGKYTGQRLRGKDPDKYQAIIRALKNGLSLRQTADVFGVNRDTVGAICIRELGRDGVRKATEKNLRLLANRAASDLLEDLDSLSPAQKSVTMGIVLDKLEKIDCRNETPTSLTQNNININATPNITPEAVKEFFSNLGSASKTFDISTEERSENETGN